MGPISLQHISHQPTTNHINHNISTYLIRTINEKKKKLERSQVCISRVYNEYTQNEKTKPRYLPETPLRDHEDEPPYFSHR